MTISGLDEIPLQFDPKRRVGYESAKLWRQRCESGFWNAFIRGPNIIDIGYRGGTLDALPLHKCARGFETGDYDGLNLPFPDGWADAVHASHLVEHITPPEIYIQEWFRVLKIGGHMILFVPHCMLYERRYTVPPSRFSPEHLAAYSPASLLAMIERSLALFVGGRGGLLSAAARQQLPLEGVEDARNVIDELRASNCGRGREVRIRVDRAPPGGEDRVSSSRQILGQFAERSGRLFRVLHGPNPLRNVSAVGTLRTLTHYRYESRLLVPRTSP